MVVAIVVLGFFGVGVDLLHQALHATSLEFLLELLEDGGELLVVSFIAAWAFALLGDTKAPDSRL